MSVAVHYYSRSGNKKAIAEAIAARAGVTAESVDPLQESRLVDVLVLGGALYAYGLDSHLADYLKTLKKEDAGKAVIFSTSWLSKHAIDLIRKGLSDAGIPVSEEVFYVRGKPSEAQLKEAAVFAEKFL